MKYSFEMNTHCKSPVPITIFVDRGRNCVLSKSKAIVFHHTVIVLFYDRKLFLYKVTR
mgnify:CR=1